MIRARWARDVRVGRVARTRALCRPGAREGFRRLNHARLGGVISCARRGGSPAEARVRVVTAHWVVP
eukprot:5456291-Pleurochrysis_carterae.AAC.1